MDRLCEREVLYTDDLELKAKKNNIINILFCNIFLLKNKTFTEERNHWMSYDVRESQGQAQSDNRGYSELPQYKGQVHTPDSILVQLK